MAASPASDPKDDDAVENDQPTDAGSSTESGSERNIDIVAELRRLGSALFHAPEPQPTGDTEVDAVQLNQRLDRLEDRIDEIRASQAQSSVVISQMAGRFDGFDQSLRDLNASIGSLAVAAAELRGEVSATFVQIERRLNASDQMFRELNLTIGSLSTAVVELRSEATQSNRRQDAMEQAYRELSSTIAGLSAKVGELGGEWKSIDARMEGVYWRQSLALAGIAVAIVGVAVAIVVGIL